MKQVKPLTEFLDREEIYKLYCELIQENERLQEELNKFNTSYYYDLEVENKKLKETNFKLFDK